MATVKRECKYTLELDEVEFRALLSLCTTMQGLESDFDIHSSDAWGVVERLVGGQYANALKHLLETK